MSVGATVLMLLNCPACERRGPDDVSKDVDTIDCPCGAIYSVQETATEIIALVRRYDIATFDEVLCEHLEADYGVDEE